MIAAIVLAAGRSSRFGGQKLIVPVAGKPLVRWTVDRVLASGVDRTFVVVPRDAAALRAALAGLAVDIVVNEASEQGMGWSITAGVHALPAETSAVLIVLGDQPAIPNRAIGALIARFREGSASIVAPVYAGARGHPVLFAASLFGELASIRGDVGAREVILRHPESIALVETDAPAPSDVNVPDDVARVEAELAKGPGSGD